MQQAIDADATPEQAVGEAILAYENAGLSVTQKMQDAWLVQARKMTKGTTTAPVEDVAAAQSGFGSGFASKFGQNLVENLKSSASRFGKSALEATGITFWTDLFGG
jgi:hypothetical protein